MVGERSRSTERSGFLNRHMPRGRFAPLLTALAIYVVIALGILVWLAWHSEETTQRRIALSPSISVTVAKNAPPPTDTEPDTAGAMPDAIDNLPETEEGEQDSPLPMTTAPQQSAVDEQPPIDKAATDQPPAETSKPVTVPATPTEPTQPEPAAVPESTVAAEPAAAAEPPPAPRLAWQANAQPFDQTDKRPRIGLIITNLGMAGAATRTAIDQTPASVTLAFQSIAPSITDWITKARSNGHEALLAVPMEPKNYPQNDPGPQTLLTSLSASANTQRLTWALARSEQIVGIIPAQGEVFVANEKAMAPIMDALKNKGLLFVDGTLNPQSTVVSLATIAQIPMAQADYVIDAAAARGAIDQALAELETQARTHGKAIGIALPYPVTFERLNAWIKTLPAKNIVLAPISALVNQQAPVVSPASTDEAPKAADPKPNPASTPALSRITPKR